MCGLLTDLSPLVETRSKHDSCLRVIYFQNSDFLTLPSPLRSKQSIPLRSLSWPSCRFLRLSVNCTFDRLILRTPPGRSWNSLDVFAKCKLLVPIAVIQGSFNIALDIFTFVLPIPIIWGLNLPFRKKIGVITIFATGFLWVLGFTSSMPQSPHTEFTVLL